MATDRQPAYDAVYRVIDQYPPRATDALGIAVENARIWRSVEAALDALLPPLELELKVARAALAAAAVPTDEAHERAHQRMDERYRANPPVEETDDDQP